MMETDLQILSGECRKAVTMLHDEKCSCVILSHGTFLVCRERGVKDLYRMLTESPELLSGAFVADKVVGKGAAAIMVAGKVRSVYTDVISRPALALFNRVGVEVVYGRCVDNIINRAGTDICPVEKLCADCLTAEECIPLIADFLRSMANRSVPSGK